METPETEQVKLTLKARTSRVRGHPGVVRINESQLKEVDFGAGDQVEMFITKMEKDKERDKSILVKISADKLMQIGYVSVRDEDMKKLDLQNDDSINFRSYTKYSESIKMGVDKIKEKLKRKKGDDEEEEETE